MKTICLLVVVLASLHGFSQKKAPSKPALSASEKKEMEDVIKELEATDPAAAKALKDVMKQMNQADVQQTVKSTTNSAKFISPRVKIPLKSPVPIPKSSDTTDRLLWLKGKKINDSMLVAPSGKIMLFSRKKNQVVIQPDPRKDPFQTIVKALARNEKAKEDFIKLMDKDPNTFFYFPAIVNNLREFDVMQEDFMQLAKNTIELEPDNEQSKQETEIKAVKAGKPDSMIPDSIKQRYAIVKEMMKNYPRLDFPEPPARPLDACFNCDSNKVKAFESELAQWRKEFARYEFELNGKAIKVLRGLDGFKGPLAAKMSADMDWGMTMAINRYRSKIALLEKQYGADFRYMQTIIGESLSLARQENLIGSGSDEDQFVFEKLIKYIDKYLAHSLKEMEEEKYPAFLNAMHLFALCRQKQFLAEPEDQSNFIELSQALHRFNRFRLSMEIDFAVTSESLKATAVLSTPKDVFVSIGMEGCKYNLFLTNTHYLDGEETEYYIPLIMQGGIKSQKEEDDKWVTYSYSGPKELMTLFPPTAIGLCSDQPDSISLSLIRYRESNLESFAGALPKAYTIDLGGLINLLILNPEGAEASVTGAREIALEMLKINSSTVSGYKSAVLDKIATAYHRFLVMKQKQIDFSRLAASNNLVLEFQTNESGEEFFTAETNYTRSGEALSVSKGKVNVKVTHAPRTD
jgi:uncharacterized protein (DUF1330 family)